MFMRASQKNDFKKPREVVRPRDVYTMLTKDGISFKDGEEVTDKDRKCELLGLLIWEDNQEMSAG
jgi:hypothetical protein